jgi:hypothetical protein
VAWFTYSPAVVDTGVGLQLTQFGHAIFSSPLMWLFVLAPLELVMLLSFSINRLSAGTALTVFLRRQSPVTSISHHPEQLLDTIAPNRCNDGKLGKMRADGIDH